MAAGEGGGEVGHDHTPTPHVVHLGEAHPHQGVTTLPVARMQVAVTLTTRAVASRVVDQAHVSLDPPLLDWLRGHG